ncbi:MAG: tRNA (adenosine(37)-N6)-dimethylallyltransferase MiaA [Candidatus Zambryskibacteria bacterium]|nr:tRNA (adenosine(37)-N6)-dimethylallyltransferase MiaA [Candidatus Zambryskibacteria bacterium]
MAKQKVLVIVGPTASGKSDLAVKLAKKFNGEVISADSRQVYKGLNVGTGKITEREMSGIPHHLLDVASPEKQFSASDFVQKAREAADMIYHIGKLPIVVGGTGFYIDALAGTVSLPEVPPSKLLRSKLGKLSKEKLFEMLGKKDPVRARTIDKHNKVRLIRALEIVETLGKVPKRQPARSTPYKFVYIGIKPKNLEGRILARLTKRLPGMITEAKKLHKKGLTYKRMEDLGLEYKFLAMYLKGEMGKEEMGEKLNIATRQYSRRQMTWFKRNKKIEWFTLSAVEGFKPEEYKGIEMHAQNMLR